jgi:Ca2+-binding EF-hand superfamily protein
VGSSDVAPKNIDAVIAWTTLTGDQKPDATLAIDLGKSNELSLSAIKDSAFAKDPYEANCYRYAGGMIHLGKTAADPSTRLKMTREFYLAPFKSALGGKSFVERAELDDDSSLSFLGSIAAYADRNGDNRLTLAELEAFLNLIEAGVRAQVVVHITDEGRSLFSLLDENQDGRLDLRELTRAGRLLTPKQIALGRDDIPRRLSVAIEQGSPGKSFGPVLIVGNRNTVAAKKTAAKAGPSWFQAMDRNGDGYLSPSEFLGAPDLFAKYDRDGDGFVSVDEANRAATPKK